jgi:hypothetical protein
LQGKSLHQAKLLPPLNTTPENPAMRHMERDVWPEWCSSMAQAAAVMGIPKARLKAVKERGGDGFENSRVNPRRVAAWMDAQATEIWEAPEEVADDAPKPKRDLKGEIDDLDEMLRQVDRLAMDAFRTGGVQIGLELAAQRGSLAKQRNDAMVQLRRQGRTEDDSIPRSEFERLCRGLAINAAHGLQRITDDVTRKLKGVSDPVEIHAILTDAMVAGPYLSAFEQTAASEVEHGLPDWAVRALKSSMEGMVE